MEIDAPNLLYSCWYLSSKAPPSFKKIRVGGLILRAPERGASSSIVSNGDKKCLGSLWAVAEVWELAA